MAKYVIDGATLKAIADAIREAAPDDFEGYIMTPEEMAAFIPDVWQAGHTNAHNTIPTTFFCGTYDVLMQTTAPDGSIAIVEDGSIAGKWVFNDEIDITLDGAFEVPCIINNYYYIGLLFSKENVVMGGLFNLPDDYADWYENGDWLNPNGITFLENSGSADLRSFIHANATRKSGGYSLYVRENGEWVYEREIDDGYDEGYQDGYDAGDTNGYNQGLEEGYQDGYGVGYTDGHIEGCQEGYHDGKQAQYDAFWDAYQQSGNQKNYTYAFSGQGWNDATFKPKYNIAPTTATNIFSNTGITDLVKCLNDAGVSLDLSNCYVDSYVAQGSKYLQTLPVLDCRKATKLTYLLFNCDVLRSVEKIILKSDGSQTIGAYFLKLLPKLEEIRFDGSIGNSFEIKDSPLLSADSVQSIIDHLAVVPVTQTLTLHANVGATITEEQRAYAISKNWSIVY